MTTKEFVEKAQNIHGNKYDYSKVNYINSHTKVCIICPEHGEFWMLPSNHYKQNCPVCAQLQRSNSRKIGTEAFIKQAKEVHGDYYDYSKVNYTKSRIPVTIICPEHGEFQQTPYKHLNGCGCFKCKSGNSKLQFIEKAKKLHGDKYDYSKVEYVNSVTDVEIICPIHGSFFQKPHVHLDDSRGYPKGCPECAKKSHGEQVIQNCLNELHYEYEYQHVIYADTILKKTNKVVVDFYLEINNKKIIIEYNGLQHYTYVPYFHKNGLSDFIKQTKRDMWLKKYCKENNIHLLIYSHRLDQNALKEKLYKNIMSIY